MSHKVSDRWASQWVQGEARVTAAHVLDGDPRPDVPVKKLNILDHLQFVEGSRRSASSHHLRSVVPLK